MGHTEPVWSVCWNLDGRRVLSGSSDGTARQWDVESGEIILEPIETGHTVVWAVVYSPDMSMIATGGHDGPRTIRALPGAIECSIKIWNTKTGELVATLKGHTSIVSCLAWTKDGKTLISGSSDNSIRTWNTKTWKQTALLEAHTDLVFAIAISPNDRILASASLDGTALLWNLDNGQPFGPPLRYAQYDWIESISFSEDGKLLATGCGNKNACKWDVAAIVTEAGLDDLLSDPKANKLALHGFFDGSPPNRSHSSARRRAASSVSPGSRLLGRLFHRNRSPSGARATPLSSPLDWTRNILKQRRQRGEGIEFQGPNPAIVEVPYAKGKRVCSFSSLIVLHHLISRREMLARGRNGKTYFLQRSLLPQVAHSLQSPMPPSHLRNNRLRFLVHPPQLPLAMLLAWPRPQRPHAQMQR
ncbi:WD40-repeat-containing domain protein [Suillus tomentosus]|nr:WD40-repeat-containing domain protein [Suillus tomentosus]